MGMANQQMKVQETVRQMYGMSNTGGNVVIMGYGMRRLVADAEQQITHCSILVCRIYLCRWRGSPGLHLSLRPEDSNNGDSRHITNANSGKITEPCKSSRVGLQVTTLLASVSADIRVPGLPYRLLGSRSACPRTTRRMSEIFPRSAPEMSPSREGAATL